MLKQIKENKIALFLIVAALLYTVWLIIYYLLIKQYTAWDVALNNNIVVLAQKCFDLFGVNTRINTESDHVILLLDAGNYRGIWVGDECNGFKLFSIFSIFIIAFPGKVSTKLWYIPLGLILIHLANVLRIMALVMINNYYPEYLDFNHLYTFTIFVYAIIFLLWYLWAKKIVTHEPQD